MIIIEDKGNKEKHHQLKHLYFEQNGVYWERYPLPVGDYILHNDAVMNVIVRKQKRNVDVKKMDFLGTYKVCVDTKKDIQEIIGNVCGKQHARFRDECILAQNNGIQLYVLVENEDGVSSPSDLCTWENPRAKMQKWITAPSGERGRILTHPDATRGEPLAKAMATMERKYGVKFLFCRPEEAGARIIELLSDKQKLPFEG